MDWWNWDAIVKKILLKYVESNTPNAKVHPRTHSLMFIEHVGNIRIGEKRERER